MTKTLVVYFTYTGTTRVVAEEKAKTENAELLELTLKKPRGKFATFIAGGFMALCRKKAKLKDFNTDFSAFGRIIIAMPIWAGNPAPAMNNIIPLVPSGCRVELIFTSGSGDSKKSGAAVTAKLAKNGAAVTSVTDIKTSSPAQ